MIDMLMWDNQVFLLLVAEMALFMLLVIPLPFSLRRRIFTYVIANGNRGRGERGLVRPASYNLGKGRCMLANTVKLASSPRIHSWQNYNTV